MSFKPIDVRNNFNQILLEMSAQFLDIASDVVERKIHMVISKPNQLKLLNLKTWADRESLSLEEVIRVLVLFWRGKHFNKKGLGVSIAVLTGKKSKEILKSYIRTTYPQRENISMRRDAVRQQIISPGEIHDFEDPFDFVVQYKDMLESAKANDLLAEKKFSRRAWRGNPFTNE